MLTFAYDDSRAIQTNPDLKSDSPLINIFYDDFWGTPLTHSGSHKSYRPLCVLTFRLNHYLGGLNPWGYHLGNILLHVLTTAVFTILAWQFCRRTFPVTVAGLVFASHPIHTEAVAGIVGRADIGACLLFQLAFLCYVKYVRVRDSDVVGLVQMDEGKSSHPDSRRYLYFLGCAFFTTASMLTKEQGVTVLGVCATYELFLHHRFTLQEIFSIFFQKKFRRALEGLLLLCLCGISLVTFRVYFMGNKPPEFAPSDNPAADSKSFLTRVLTFNLLPAYNFWMFLCPRVLSFDWSMEAVPLVESLADPRLLFVIIFYGSLGFVGLSVLKEIPSASRTFKVHANGNGCAIGSNSNSNFVQKSVSNSGKKKPSRKLSTSSTDSNEDTVVKKSQKTSLDVLILSLALIIFPFIPATNLFFYVGFVIAERVLYIPSMGFCLLIGQGAYVLYQKFSRDKGKRKIVCICLCVLLGSYSIRTVVRNQDWQTEEKLYESGLRVNPAKGWGNLANIYYGQGRSSEAEAAYRNALKYRGNMADVHYNLGILLQDQKRYAEAIESYKMAISCRPRLTMAHLNLGIILGLQGKVEEAVKVYQHCYQIDTSGLKDPRLHENTKISALYNLGKLLVDHNRIHEGIKAYREAIRRRPSYYPPQSIYNMLGEAYLKLNQYEEAEHWYREALKTKPDHVPAHLTMANLKHKQGLSKEAEVWYRKAMELDPQDTAVRQHYAQYLADSGKVTEAIEAYRKLVDERPEDFELLFNTANVFRQATRNSEAEDMYRKATFADPNMATGHMNLGAMLHFNGKLAEAEQSYLAALKLKPDDEMTKQNLVRLRNLMTSKGKS
ncbi:protein O-mannosyl-transferase TMTC2-like [Liolophura sinensis]|uniref:protein O-mannosyl-transferase TMTC2-like n=1 Tax=Liolophura sinensis TaxID=3198878 RepID=UPI0031583046